MVNRRTPAEIASVAIACLAVREGLARPLVGRAVLLIALSTIGGCSSLLYRFKTDTPPVYVANPVTLPPSEDNFVWLQVVDVVDDYFHIRTEQPVQNRGDMILDGRLETSYRPGASISEPWRKDSTSGFERLQSTFQSIRRKATVTVRPEGAGYELEVVVVKELEDTDRSQYATEGASAIRRDVTIVRTEDGVDDTPRTLGWIPLGRDESLEQVILQDILGRTTKPDGKRLLHHR
ncbi:MAG: hypothetical protein ACO1RT_18990 [Planctomycetaceae bacterium]